MPKSLRQIALTLGFTSGPTSLQRAHIARLGILIADQPAAPTPPGFPATPLVVVAFSDIRPLVRAPLTGLRTAVRVRIIRTPGPVTKAHLEDVAVRIGEILEGDRHR